MKNIFIISIISLMIVGSIAGVLALPAEQYPSQTTIWWNNLKHSLNIQPFSVVGTNQACGLAGGNPNYEWSVASGSNFQSGVVLSGNRPASLCSNPIIDIFTNGWVPFVETKNFLTYGSCGTGACNIQIYCCPHPEPTSQTDCNSWNLGTFNSITCPVWTGTSFYKCPTETGIPYYYNSYKYCSLTQIHRCYYKPTGASTCSYYDYSGVTSCSQVGSPAGYYNGHQLFESQSTCDASQSCQNNCNPSTKQCSGNGYQNCELKSNGCYDWSSVINCESGQTCSGGVCQAGTTATCSDGIKNQDETGIDCGGVCPAACQINGTTCPSGTQKCSDGTCQSSCTAIDKLSMTQDAFDTATPEQIAGAVCRLGYECPITYDKILTNAEINVEDYNWTIKCVSSASIKETNKLAILEYLKLTYSSNSWWTTFFNYITHNTNDPNVYETYCADSPFILSLMKFFSGLATKDQCKQTLADIPSGTCRATIKASSTGFCWQQANTWLSGITKSTDCQTNTIILIVVVIGGFILILKFAGGLG